MKKVIRFICFMLLALMVCLAGCSKKDREVVVYTSLDKVFSQPVLEEFERKTGIKVKAVYDSEATKTTGLVNRLIAEKDAPRADVFWNSETGRTIVLKQKGVLAPYKSPSAADIPATFKDKDGYWSGFGARCRILIYNTDLLKKEELPKSIFELTENKWKGKVSLAYPLFGTTATHAAALFVYLGEEKAKEYFKALKANDVMITDGNASSRDRVADGTVAIGFTDTDDAFVAIKQGRPVDIVWPDNRGMGTLLIPNTVALIKNGPNEEAGKKFIDFLLSKKTEEMLAFSDAGQIPLRDYVKRPSYVPTPDKVKAMDVDFEKVAELFKQATTKIPTPVLNKVIEEIAARKVGGSKKTGVPKIYYATQVAVRPATLLLFVNRPELFDDNFQRFAVNRLRELLGIKEVPIRLLLRARR